MKLTTLIWFVGCVIIAAACFLAYSPAIKGDFLWDDTKYVVNNPLLSAPDGLWRIWFSTDVPSQYFPLIYTTFRIEYRLWGLNPIGYHVTNISLHIISSILLWLILRRLSIPAAFAAAAAFALHPINAESVAWIAQRKNTLMLVFLLLSALFYIEFALRTRTARQAIFFYVLSLFCFALSLFSKTTACVLPIVLILILWMKNIPLTARRLLQLVPYLSLAVAMGLLTMWWEHHHQGVALIDLGLSFQDKLLIASRALWFYGFKTFFPANLVFSYPRWKINSADPSQYLWFVACLLTAAGLFLFRKRIGRGPIVAILFFAIALFPMLGFFQLYTFIYTFVADHYSYIAIIGLLTLIMGSGVFLLARLGNLGKTLQPVTACVVLLTLGILTWRQSRLYADPELIWQDTLRKNPNSWLAHNNLGQIKIAQNKLDEAIYHITRSLELAKDTPVIHPHNIAAAHFNLALAYQGQQKFDDAIRHLRQALDIDPNDAEVHFDLAKLLESQGLLDEAVTHYNQALRITPGGATLHYRLASALAKQGDVSAAITNLHRALDIEPDYVAALDMLVGLFVTRTDADTRHATKALEYARRAVEQTGRRNPVVLNLLAMAHASNNQFTEAIAVAEEALKIAADAGADELADFIRKQLKSYEKELK
jgi:tetratricopeptide (TPR) repeat protein